MVAVNIGPAVVDLNGIRAGDKNEISVTVSSKGTPLNLTDMQVAAQARSTASSPVALSAVVTVVDAAAGKVAMSWPGDDVRALMGTTEQWRGVWDLQLGTEDDTAVTVCAGAFVANLDVTRSA
jgi:hypothetical protein